MQKKEALRLLNEKFIFHFSCIVYYFTKVKSKAISKKIMMIKEEIKKSFLCITISLLPYLVGDKHSTVSIS